MESDPATPGTKALVAFLRGMQTSKDASIRASNKSAPLWHSKTGLSLMLGQSTLQPLHKNARQEQLARSVTSTSTWPRFFHRAAMVLVRSVIAGMRARDAISKFVDSDTRVLARTSAHQRAPARASVHQQDSKGACQIAPACASRTQQVSARASACQQVPAHASACQRVPECTSAHQRVPARASTCQHAPAGLKMHQHD
jgi:hypothetical protein